MTARGLDVEAIGDLYPDLSPEQIEAALAWPADPCPVCRAPTLAQDRHDNDRRDDWVCPDCCPDCQTEINQGKRYS